MPARLFVTTLIIVWLFTWSLIPLAAADPEAAKAAAKLLLDQGWEKTGAARKIVDQCDLESPAQKDDLLLLAAHWLTLMQQGRYEQSLQSLEKFLALQPSHLQALRAQTWLLTVTKDYRRALVVADRLGQAASQMKSTGNSSAADPNREAIVFAGRLVGFLEGPVGSNVDDALLSRFEAQFVERLDDQQRKAFADAKDALLQKYAKFASELSGAAEEAQEDAQTAKKANLERLAKDNDQLVKDAAKVEQQAKSAQIEQAKQLNQLRRQDAAIEQRLNMLQNQKVLLGTQYNQLQTDQRNLQAKAANEQNPANKQRLEADARRLQGQLNSLQRESAAIDGQLTATQANRNLLQQKANVLSGNAAAEGKQLEDRRRGIDKQKFRNENKQKREEKSKATATGKMLTLQTEARAFSTYEEFPLEELKAKLLEKLR